MVHSLAAVIWAASAAAGATTSSFQSRPPAPAPIWRAGVPECRASSSLSATAVACGRSTRDCADGATGLRVATWLAREERASGTVAACRPERGAPGDQEWGQRRWGSAGRTTGLRAACGRANYGERGAAHRRRRPRSAPSPPSPARIDFSRPSWPFGALSRPRWSFVTLVFCVLAAMTASGECASRPPSDHDRRIGRLGVVSISLQLILQITAS